MSIFRLATHHGWYVQGEITCNLLYDSIRELYVLSGLYEFGQTSCSMLTYKGHWYFCSWRQIYVGHKLHLDRGKSIPFLGWISRAGISSFAGLKLAKNFRCPSMRHQKTNRTGWNFLYILEVLSFCVKVHCRLLSCFGCLQDNHRYTFVMQLFILINQLSAL